MEAKTETGTKTQMFLRYSMFDNQWEQKRKRKRMLATIKEL